MFLNWSGASMKYLDEFVMALLRRMYQKIASLAEGLDPVTIMEVCGSHTMSIYRYGLKITPGIYVCCQGQDARYVSPPTYRCSHCRVPPIQRPRRARYHNKHLRRHDEGPVPLQAWKTKGQKAQHCGGLYTARRLAAGRKPRRNESCF